jgi:hypothetical protein
MKRRTLLKTSALATLALAGCVGGDDGSGADGDPTDTPAGTPTGTPTDAPTGTPTDAPTDEPTDTPTETPRPISVAGATVETDANECGSGESTASIDFDDDDDRVTFAGALTASNPCHEATLEGVAYDDERDALVVILGTESTDETCVDCVGRVEFSGAVDLDGGLPSRVYLEHEDAVLASAAPGDAPALVGRTFELVDDAPEEVDVAFDSRAGEVVVEGTIRGSNGCKTAELGAVGYDPDGERLRVDVVTTVREGSEDRSCTQAIVSLGYRATFSFEGGLPGTVGVSHDGRGVVTAGSESTMTTPTED